MSAMATELWRKTLWYLHQTGHRGLTYLILRETPWGTPTLTVAPRTLCRLIFLSAPYSTTVPKNPDLQHKDALTVSLPAKFPWIWAVSSCIKTTNHAYLNGLKFDSLYKQIHTKISLWLATGILTWLLSPNNTYCTFDNILYWALNLCLLFILKLVLVGHHHKRVRNAKLQTQRLNDHFGNDIDKQQLIDWSLG